LEVEGASLEIVAPTVGGIVGADGSKIKANYNLEGGPSVLFDAVAVLASESTGRELARLPPARSFVTDAFTHCKFIGYGDGAMPLFEATNLASMMDDGFIQLRGESDVRALLQSCRKLRLWDREEALAA
jgi:catalase